MGNQSAATSARLTVVYSSSVSSKRFPDVGTVSTGLMEGQTLRVSFQGGTPLRDSVASTAGSGAAKKMYRVKNADSGEFYALKTPGRREDVVDHVVAATFAKDFGNGIRFVVPVLARVDVALDEGGNRVQEWEGAHVLLEHLLQGTYKKFVCRRHKFGDGTFIYHDLPQAFFHYTYESSRRSLVIWDLQGVREDNGNFLLTDPYIVNEDHTIWRYGEHHNTFRCLHTKCNAQCPGHYLGTPARKPHGFSLVDGAADQFAESEEEQPKSVFPLHANPPRQAVLSC